MIYTLSAAEVKRIGLRIDQPGIEKIEIRDDGSEIQARVLSKWVCVSAEKFAQWKKDKELLCQRCEHQWISILTSDRPPRACPKCRSPYWDRPRKPKPIITPMLIEKDGKMYRVEFVCFDCGTVWPKDAEKLNVSCPKCRRKCGSNSRWVSVEVSGDGN